MRRVGTGALVALLVAAGLAACSSGGDDDDSSASGSDGTARNAETTAPPDTKGLTPDLTTILGRQQDAVIKVTYKRGEDTFTIAQDHEQRSVTTGTSMSIVTPVRSVDCTDIDTKPVCLEVPEGVSSLVNTGLLVYDNIAQGLASAAEQMPPIPTTTEKVAGRPAVCAEGDASTFLSGIAGSIGTVPEQKVRACIDAATGYLLEYSGSDDPTDKLVATRVEKPTAADFKPPARVQGF
jgi:hypothetical protein